jgi:hypothetical protein
MWVFHMFDPVCNSAVALLRRKLCKEIVQVVFQLPSRCIKGSSLYAELLTTPATSTGEKNEPRFSSHVSPNLWKFSSSIVSTPENSYIQVFPAWAE